MVMRAVEREGGVFRAVTALPLDHHQTAKTHTLPRASPSRDKKREKPKDSIVEELQQAGVWR